MLVELKWLRFLSASEQKELPLDILAATLPAVNVW
jgi:hypothetical protein